MPSYVFYKKDIELKIFEKDKLSTNEIKNLLSDGFEKINIGIEAKDENEAIGELIKQTDENSKSNNEFNKDIKVSSVSSVIESLIR
ncbi:hypothetical protein [Yersinia bercovieri]|uniref:hypothetical protein n=1 Tax=Yersinia bercovieri TaxID=634 RepID=UPI0030CE4CB3